MKPAVSTNQVLPVLLFFTSLIILLLTVVPTIYTLDSAELTVASKTLGIAHAPGYPLYLMAGHVFTWLPFGDVGYRVNLFSAVCLAATAPAVYALINHLIHDRAIACGTALIVVWSYYVWTNGIVAEVYAPQVFTLAASGWWLARMAEHRSGDTRSVIVAGLLVGIAIAMHPSSILFAPGAAVIFLLRRVPWRQCVLAALIAAVVVSVTVLYLPIRYNANPALNMAGWYNVDGSFHRVNLQSAHGLWWMLRGQQFENFFFADGVLPTAQRARDVVSWFASNYLGIGILLGVLGLGVLGTSRRGLLLAWLVCFVPFTFFYINYGAVDLETMLGPVYLVWSVVLAVGWQWATEFSPRWAKVSSVVLLPVIFLIVNFPLIKPGSNTEIRERSEALFEQIPPDAAVFGVWWDIVPLQYLQIVEGQRDDLALYNLFQLDVTQLAQYLDGPMIQPGQPVIIISALGLLYLGESDYDFVPLWEEDDPRLDTIGGHRVVKRDES